MKFGQFLSYLERKIILYTDCNIKYKSHPLFHETFVFHSRVETINSVLKPWRVAAKTSQLVLLKFSGFPTKIFIYCISNDKIFSLNTQVVLTNTLGISIIQEDIQMKGSSPIFMLILSELKWQSNKLLHLLKSSEKQPFSDDFKGDTS